MAPPSDPLNPTLADIMRRRGAQTASRNEIAEQMLPPTVAQHMAPFTARLGGLQSGLADIVNRSIEASPPVQIHNMYEQLQQGARPEDLAGRSFRTAFDMALWGLGGTIPSNAAGSLRLRKITTMGHDNDLLGKYNRHYEIYQGSNSVPIGGMAFTYDARTKELYVDWMGTERSSPVKGTTAEELNENAWSLGPAELMTLGPEIRREFPFAKTLVFERSSGARTAGENPGEIRPLLRRRLPWADEDDKT
jgi:hypothetical protein